MKCLCSQCLVFAMCRARYHGTNNERSTLSLVDLAKECPTIDSFLRAYKYREYVDKVNYLREVFK